MGRHGHYFALKSQIGGGGGGGGGGGLRNTYCGLIVCVSHTHPIHANGHMTSSSCHAAIL